MLFRKEKNWCSAKVVQIPAQEYSPPLSFETLDDMAHLELWPPLPLNEWQDTRRTLHMWTQIVGKIRMALTPPLNHWWHVTLYVNSRGLTTGPVPYPSGVFEIQLDFERHELCITTSQGQRVVRPLRPESVASFYESVFETLRLFGILVTINPKPQEIADPIPFDRDHADGSYDADYVNRFWRILLSSSKVFERFRGKFLGKCSPVHFFWGSFDLACTRFSGRPAPPRNGAITGPAYSHEVSSAGFWPGGGGIDAPAYYTYTVPTPSGIEQAQIRPGSAGWNSQLSEFTILFDELRRAPSPEQALYEFLESTYEAGASLGHWDRASLEV
jgi:hypothetical protein